MYRRHLQLLSRYHRSASNKSLSRKFPRTRQTGENHAYWRPTSVVHMDEWMDKTTCTMWVFYKYMAMWTWKPIITKTEDELVIMQTRIMTIYIRHSDSDKLLSCVCFMHVLLLLCMQVHVHMYVHVCRRQRLTSGIFPLSFFHLIFWHNVLGDQRFHKTRWPATP